MSRRLRASLHLAVLLAGLAACGAVGGEATNPLLPGVRTIDGTVQFVPVEGGSDVATFCMVGRIVEIVSIARG